MLDMGSLADHHAKYRPGHPALILAGRTLSWRDFANYVKDFGCALTAAGLRQGDHFATVLPNGLELMAAYWAAARTGTVIVPLSPLLQPSGLARLLDQSDSVLVIGHVDSVGSLQAVRDQLPRVDAGNRILIGGAGSESGFRSFDDFLAAGRDVDPARPRIAGEDLFNIMYSSGTTGLPKGIMHSHAVRAMYALIFAQSCRIGPDSVILHAGSIVFNGAMVDLMPWMLAGASYVLHERFDAERVLEDIREHRVTHMVMVPAQIIALLQHDRFCPEAVSSLQMLMSLGAPLPQRCKDLLAERLPGRFCELYGVTEGIMTVLDREQAPLRPGSVGCPPPFMTVSIRREDGSFADPGEVGEIVGQGPCVMQGYYRQPELTAEVLRDGWLHTGDAGFLDADGHLHLVDRIKDVIISGGVNVYPTDIEQVLCAHPSVHEVAVFGVPDERWGEVPVAAVKADAAGIDAATLLLWTNERVDARYQRLKAVYIVDEFPRNVAGKILKRQLRDRFADG